MRVRDLFVRLGFVVLGGCTFHASCNAGGLNMTNAQAFVSTIVEDYAGVKPTSVTCPEHVAIAKDATFACSFEVAGIPGALTLTQTSDKGDINVKMITGIIASKKLEAVIDDSVAKAPGPLHANCGERVHPSHPGDKLTCDVNGPSGLVAHAAVVIKDEANNIDYKVTAVEEPAQ